MKEWLKKDKLAYLATALFALILILSIFVFQFGLSATGESYSRLIHLGLYDFQNTDGMFPTAFGVEASSEGLVTSDFVYALVKMFHPVNSQLYVFIPAAIYVLLLIAGFYMIVKNLFSKYNWNNVLLAVLSIFIIADTGYTVFLNTHYVDAAYYSYLIFAIGALIWASKDEKRVLPIIFSGIGCGLFAGSSKMCAWIGFLFAIYFVRLLFAKKGVVQKILCIVFAITTVFSSVYLLFISDYKPDEKSIYGSVFYGVSVNDPSHAVNLGISEEDAKAYYGKADDVSLENVSLSDQLALIDTVDIGSYYLTHPKLFYENMKRVAQNSTVISIDYLGNYSANSGKAYQQTGFFKLYGNFKRVIVPASLPVILILLLALIAGTIFYRKKYAEDTSAKLVCDLTVIGVIGAFIAFVLPLIYGGFLEIGLRLHLFNLLFDLCVLSAVVGGTKLLWKRRELLKEKFGVNQ